MNLYRNRLVSCLSIMQMKICKSLPVMKGVKRFIMEIIFGLDAGRRKNSVTYI